MSLKSRREFLKTGFLSAMFLGSAPFVARPANTVVESKNEGQAKNVIFLVSDGMSAGTLTMADLMLRRMEGRSSNWARMYSEGRAKRGLMDMASANRIVTDSAAAAASWGCGHRVNNGSLNICPEGRQYKPIIPIFRDAGKAAGLVTTSEITHATPAGFAANVESRSEASTIAMQYLDREVEVLLGGGRRFFSKSERKDGKDIYSGFKLKGYDVVNSREDMKRSQSGKILGTFSRSHLPFVIDRRNSSEYSEIPSLAEMTETALEKLSQNPNGFILQVEGARVDHAAHQTDIGALLFEQMDFDEALGTAIRFAENREDTLVIATTDHGNGNPGFSSSPDEDFEQIYSFKSSGGAIHREMGRWNSVSTIQNQFEASTGLRISRAEARAYQLAHMGVYRGLNTRMRDPRAVFSTIVSNHTNVNFVSGSHTADYVEVMSFGPGSEAVEGFIRNTDLFDVMVAAAGVFEVVE